MGMTVKIRANPRLVHGGPESGVAELAFTGSATALSTRLSDGVAGFAVTASAYAERTGDAATAGAGTLTVTGSATTTVVHQVLTAEGAATVTFTMAGFAEADAATGAATMSFTGAAAVNVTRTQAGAATLAVTAAGHICSEGEYLSFITGLASGTTYHVRAYATNEEGTGYGAEVDFAAAGSTRTAAGAAGFTITSYMGASSPLYDVMDYGAHADGVTTDVDHIQAAITAASATGGTVYLPTGTYYLATTLTLPSGSKLLGDGMALTWLKGTVTYDGSSTLTGICTGAGGLFDVTDYGATHSGTHDDAPHIRDAITACSAAGGGVVYFPAGSYWLDAGYDAPNGSCKGHIYLKSHVTLQGDGVGQTILNGAYVPGDLGRSIIISTVEHDIGINNLSITSPIAQLAATTKDGYKLMGCDTVNVHDTYVENCYIGFNFSGCQHVVATDLTHPNCKIPFSATIASWCSGIAGGADYMPIDDVVLTRCEASGASSSGFAFGFAIAISDAWHAANPTVTISNVTLDDCYSHDNTAWGSGAYFRWTDRTTIINSRFIDNYEYAVRMGYCTNYWMASNTATGNGTSNALPYNEYGAANTARGSL